MARLEEKRLLWTTLDRGGPPCPGVGKWKLESRMPKPIYAGVAEAMRAGKLEEVVTIKTRTVPERTIEAVYVYTAPYWDLARVYRVAQALQALVDRCGWQLDGPLEFKTDLATFWHKGTDVEKDPTGKPAIWGGRSWLYRYTDPGLTVNEHLTDWHQRLERCQGGGDPVAWELRRLLPEYVFGGEAPADARDRFEREHGAVLRTVHTPAPATAANEDPEVSFRYHDETKHSEAKLAVDDHFLDPSNRPIPFKLYRATETVPLPAAPEILFGATPPAIDVCGYSPPDAAARTRVPSLVDLARVLYLSAGITKAKSAPGGEIYFRAYANTGALYHLDLYLVSADLPDLAAGVYHFAPHDFSLHRLRDGDFRAVLAAASGAHHRVREAPVTIVSASTYWRNAWKYRERTWRHCFWDAGTMHANLLAIAAAERLDPVVVLGFADAEVESLLGLDPQREGALTLVPIGRGEAVPNEAPPAPGLELETEPISPSQVDYPLIREAHAASSLGSGDEAADWRHRRWETEPPRATGEIVSLEGIAPISGSRTSLAHVIRKRGSTRAFHWVRPIPLAALSALLERATSGYDADVPNPPGASLLDWYLIVNAVDGLVAGTYYYRRREHALERLREGNFRQEAGRLALGQSLAADASVNVYSLTPLPEVLGRFGNRGYRAAQLAGGIAAGRMYMAAYAQGFGATGLTFFDDAVVDLFSPRAAGSGVMFLTALGHPDRAALARM